MLHKELQLTLLIPANNHKDQQYFRKPKILLLNKTIKVSKT